MLHQFVSERYQVPLEYLIVQRNGWMEVESLHVRIPHARILMLYYYLSEERGGYYSDYDSESTGSFQKWVRSLTYARPPQTREESSRVHCFNSYST